MRLRLVIATTLIAAVIAVALGGSGALTIAYLEFVEHAWAPALWVAAAVGYGALLQRALRSRVAGAATESWAIAACLGIAIHLWLDDVAGCLGASGLAGAVYALADALGVALLVLALRRRVSHNPIHLNGVRVLGILSCLIPLATLIVAALSTPGFLWRTEFGGYDALSYHLQLPKEWLELGRITPLMHNCYSALPGYVEAAFLHLFAVRGSAHAAAVDAQLLSAAFVVVAACAVAEAARVSAPRGTEAERSYIGAPLFAAIVFLGVPWVIVTGSLAYDESAVCAMVAGAMVLALDRSSLGSGGFVLLGVLLGGAVCAKASAVGVGCLGVALLALTMAPSPRRLTGNWCMWMAAAGLLMIAPWMVRNAVEIDAPLFPLLSDGWWTHEQALRFAVGHATPPVADWAGNVWNQLLRFGIGPDARTGDVWLPQWSVLWVLVIVASVALVHRPSPLRRRAILLSGALLVSLGFWLFLTHQKSRFMLPAAPIAAVLVGLAAARVELYCARRWASVALALLALLWGSLPLTLLRGEGRGQPLAALGARGIMDGSASPAAAAAGELGPAAFSNQLPAGERVACLGLTNVFWFQVTPQYSTVWDTPTIDSWPTALSQNNVTQLIVNDEMLDIWSGASWIDPAINPTSRKALLSRLPRATVPAPGAPSPWHAFRLNAD